MRDSATTLLHETSFAIGKYCSKSTTKCVVIFSGGINNETFEYETIGVNGMLSLDTYFR